MQGKTSIANSIKQLPKHINLSTVSSGFLAGVFGWTTTLIIVNAANAAGLSQAETISWVFACWFFGPVLGLILSLKHQMPIPGAWSIPGAAVVASALGTYTLQEMQGAYLVAGVVVLILGLTGSIGKVMRFLPMPIVMAMIAGALLRFGTGMVIGFQGAPLVVGVTVLVFLITTKLKSVIKVPPILITFLAAIGMSLATGSINFAGMEGATFVLPSISIPGFNLGAIFSVSLPLILLVIGAENAQATGVLMSQGYKPPVNDMTIWSGIGGIVTSFFGGPNANIAGPMTAICASEASGEKVEGRYASVVINAITCGAVGLFASIIVPFISILPAAFISVVAGLAMIGVIASSLRDSFGKGKMLEACFFAFVVAAANISIFGVGAAFWALLVGVFVAWILSPKEFKDFISASKAE